MNFEEYLKSKKIDPDAFRAAEESMWSRWQKEFEQVSPTSFTAQKLYLINPLRRKFRFAGELAPKTVAVNTNSNSAEEKPDSASGELLKTVTHPEVEKKPSKPVVARPVFKPKPKMN